MAPGSRYNAGKSSWSERRPAPGPSISGSPPNARWGLDGRQRKEQRHQSHDALFVDQECLTRFPAPVERRGRGGGRYLGQRSIGVQWRRRRGQHIAVHGLDRSDALDEQIDALSVAPHACADPRCDDAIAAHPDRNNRAAPSPRRIRPAPSCDGPPPAARGRLDVRVELFGDRQRSTTATVDAAGRGGEGGAEFRQRPGQLARPRQLPTGECGGGAAVSAGSPSRSSAAAIVSSATESKSMRWHRDRIVASKSSGAEVTRITTVRSGGSSSVFSIAFADSF